MHKNGAKALLTRRQLFAAGAAVGAATLYAPYVKAQSKARIRLMNTETAIPNVEAFKEIAAAYNKASGVELIVDNVEVEDSLTKLSASMRSGNPYDMSVLGFIGDVLLLADQDFLVPVDDLVAKYEWGPRILFPYKGHTWWYPYDYNFCVTWYRKDLYAKSGLKVPTNRNEFLANAEKLNSDSMNGCMYPTGNTSATQWMTSGFFFAEGVNFLDDDLKVVLDQGDNKSKAVETLDYFNKLYQFMPAGMSQAAWAQALGQFANQQVAHAPYSARMIDNLAANAPDLADQVGLFPYYSSSGDTASVGFGYDGFVILNTPQAEESRKFMAWFADNMYIRWLQAAPLAMQPARLDVYEDKRWLEIPMIQKYKGVMDELRAMIGKDSSVQITSLDTQGKEPNIQAAKIYGSRIYNEMLQSVTLKQRSSAEAVDVAAQQMRKLIG
ncbi:MAG TPA: extracellular solute-binding protein [Dongiaceae bacterium]|jgi:multiple sugar transport system substrate-binding protein|nr:extracellular solute-binding protein [Dongiaceae bacterium]